MASDLIQILIFLGIVLAGTPLLGGYMARVFAGERTLLSPVLGPVERGFYARLRRRPRQGAALDRATRSPCSPSTPLASCCSTPSCGCSTCCR